MPSPSQGNITGELSTNGWTKLPNGLIIQWGNLHTYGYNNILYFPIRYNKLLSFTATQGESDPTGTISFTIASNNSINIRTNDSQEDDEPRDADVFWMALGY